jgi:hypothetical protein
VYVIFLLITGRGLAPAQGPVPAPGAGGTGPAPGTGPVPGTGPAASLAGWCAVVCHARIFYKNNFSPTVP